MNNKGPIYFLPQYPCSVRLLGRILFLAMLQLRRLRAVILAAVLATVPSRATPTSAAPVSSSAPSAAPVSSSAPDPAEPLEEPFGDRDRMRGRVGLGQIFGVGILPVPGLGLHLDLGFQWRRFAMSIEGRFLGTPNFSLDTNRSARAFLVLGVVSICYDVWPFPRPLYSLEWCPFVGIGRLGLEPVNSDGSWGIADAHPFDGMVGMRFLVGWQFSHKNAPEFRLKPFVEMNVGFVRNRVSWNNIDVWDANPPVGGVLGIELSAVLSQPATWNRPAPSKTVTVLARSTP
jgi:hypothetical protein